MIITIWEKFFGRLQCDLLLIFEDCCCKYQLVVWIKSNQIKRKLPNISYNRLLEYLKSIGIICPSVIKFLMCSLCISSTAFIFSPHSGKSTVGTVSARLLWPSKVFKVSIPGNLSSWSYSGGSPRH